jgi:hypothetical protein
MTWLFIPFIIQAIAIGIDEYYFHLKRGLPRWERIGHPLDTLSLLACLFFVTFSPFSPTTLKWYSALSILSCLMVTKDEFIHKHHCPPAEHWLHALLFLNHPLLLICSGLMWRASSGKVFLITQAIVGSAFFFYQLVYWNYFYESDQ